MASRSLAGIAAQHRVRTALRKQKSPAFCRASIFSGDEAATC